MIVDDQNGVPHTVIIPGPAIPHTVAGHSPRTTA